MNGELIVRFDDLGFDDNFFEQYERDLESVDFRTVAMNALDGILLLEDDNGRSKTYAELKAETEIFFANEMITRDIELLDELSRRYANYCNHNHDAEKQLNDGPLSDIFNRGNELIKNQESKHPEDTKRSKKRKISKSTGNILLKAWGSWNKK